MPQVSTSAPYAEAVSPSGRYLATVQKVPAANGKDDGTVRIYVVDCLRACVAASIACNENHGSLASSGGTFACMAFSPDETRLLYAAEPKEKKETAWCDLVSAGPEKGGGATRATHHTVSQAIRCIPTTVAKLVSPFPLF